MEFRLSRKSAPVTTESTPGRAAARETSMDLMPAWAWGLLKKTTWAILGRLMSPV